MIKEFYVVPWLNHDDSSLHSSKSSHSSSSSSEDTHNSTLAEDSIKNGTQGQNLISDEIGRSTSLHGSEAANHCREASTIDQNKTIHFQDIEGSVGDMNLTSNISELSMSICPIENADVNDLSSVFPWSLEEKHEFKDLSQQNSLSGRQVKSSTNQVVQEHVTMEITRNVNNTSWEGTNDKIIYTRQLSEDFTEDMELTADLMYSSRTALIDIPVNASAMPRDTGVKFSTISVPVMKPFVADPSEDQENNPMLILRHAQSTNHKTPLSPLMINASKMELTTNITFSSDDFDNHSERQDIATDNHSTNESVNQGIIDSDSSERKSRREKILGHDAESNSIIGSGNKRSRLTDQLTGQVLSPVVEMSGLNFSSWSGSQVSSSFSRTSAISSPNKDSSKNSLQDSQDKSNTKTIYFASVSAKDMEKYVGDIEITSNIPCDIQEGPIFPQSILNQGVVSDQSTETNPYELERKNMLGVEPPTDVQVNPGSSLQANILHTYISESKPSQNVSDCQLQTNTIYFGSGEAVKSEDMELTESVPFFYDIGDPEIKISSSKNKNLSSGISEEIMGNRGDQSVNSSKKNTHITPDHENQNLSAFSNMPCKSFEVTEKSSTGICPESLHGSINQKQESHAGFDQPDHAWSATGKKVKTDIIVKKTDAVKSNLMKDMGSLLTLSRRSSILQNKKVFNAKRSLGGLLLNHQDKSRRKSNIVYSDSIQDGQDEVDGMISASMCDHKINSSDIVSVFGETNSSTVSSLNIRNSAFDQSMLSEKKHQLIDSGSSKESISTVPSSKDKCQKNAQINISAANISRSGAEFEKNSFSPPVSHLGKSMYSPGKESFDETDLTDEHEMLDFTEDLNVHNLLGKCAVDEEAPEDFLQDLECVMSKAAPVTPKSQEVFFTLQDLFHSIDFDKFTSLPEDKIVLQREVQVNTIKGRLLAKIADVTKINCLQNFVREMDCRIKKLKQENMEKLDQIQRDQNKTESLLTMSKESMKPIALEMCKACRILSRSGWWQQEADHLIEYSTERETTFETFKSDRDFFRKETDGCSELIKEIDECLHEIDLIQEMKKDLNGREVKFSELNREICHMKERSEEFDNKTQFIQDRCKELASSSETISFTHEEIKEKLWWLESLSEWTLLEQSNERIVFGFLFNTLVLQVHLDRDSPESRNISDITLRGRLSSASKPWAKLSHHLAVSSIDCGVLKRKYSSLDHLSKILLDVSTVAFNSRQLNTELRQAHFNHRISINGFMLQVYILESKKRQKVCLQTKLEPHLIHSYLNSKLSWTVTTLFGTAEPDVIMKIINQVSPGHQYLTRIFSAVETILSQIKRSDPRD
ncbi:hypothetical protein EGW08_010542 [Elysia chlorotica]|uniref:Knl1 C-terminal RWD domain-containing protein n=1 Tax=Elysia chlorotica TaxID=188477 RepID=A0A433TJB4_ELYCH|nr:hypothetical protein EGW08_010542 [Elysia chlorotica]